MRIVDMKFPVEKLRSHHRAPVGKTLLFLRRYRNFKKSRCQSSYQNNIIEKNEIWFFFKIPFLALNRKSLGNCFVYASQYRHDSADHSR